MSDITKVTRTMFGYKEDENGAYVLLTNEQYESMYNQIFSYNAQLDQQNVKLQEKDRALFDLRKKLEQAENRLKKLERDADNAIYRAEEESEKAQECVKKMRTQTDFEVEQMKRILRDHANKERDIPRRAPGYVVVDIEAEQNVYKSVVSTPWPVGMDLELVQQYCIEDGFGGLFTDFTVAQSECANERIYRLNGKSRFNANGMENGPVVFKLQFRTGKDFWECRISHFGYVRYGAGGRKPKQQQEEVKEVPAAKPQPAKQPQVQQSRGRGLRM